LGALRGSQVQRGAMAVVQARAEWKQVPLEVVAVAAPMRR
jgi:hypothetical protein